MRDDVAKRFETWIDPVGCDANYKGSHPDLDSYPRPDPDLAWKRFCEQWEKWTRLTPLALGKR